MSDSRDKAFEQATGALRVESEARWDELRAKRVLTELHARRRERTRVDRRGVRPARRVAEFVLVAAAAAAAAVLAGRLIGSESAPAKEFAANPHMRSTQTSVSPQIARVGARSQVVVEGRPVDVPAGALTLPDGSELHVDPGARLSIESLEPERVGLRQLDGVVRYRVSHRPERAFEIVTESATVRVRGTMFDVVVDESATEVRVIEGRVEVDDGTRQTSLSSGEIWRVTRPTYASAPLRGPVTGLRSAPRVEPSGARSVPRSSVPPSEPGRGAPNVESAYPARRAHESPGSAREPGVDADPLARLLADTPDALVVAADVARREERYDDAAALLVRAESAATRRSERARVVFMLGRVDLARGRPATAAEAFGRASELDPLGPLSEDAVASAARAWAAAGDASHARDSAAQYLARWPSGLHMLAMRRLVP